MKIVFLDDEEFLFSLVSRYFTMLKVRDFVCTSSVDKAKDCIIAGDFQILMIDYNMPELPDINDFVFSLPKETKIIVVSGDEINYIYQNLMFNFDFLKKPFMLEDLQEILNKSEVNDE